MVPTARYARRHMQLPCLLRDAPPRAWANRVEGRSSISSCTSFQLSLPPWPGVRSRRASPCPSTIANRQGMQHTTAILPLLLLLPSAVCATLTF